MYIYENNIGCLNMYGHFDFYPLKIFPSIFALWFWALYTIVHFMNFVARQSDTLGHYLFPSFSSFSLQPITVLRICFSIFVVRKVVFVFVRIYIYVTVMIVDHGVTLVTTVRVAMVTNHVSQDLQTVSMNIVYFVRWHFWYILCQVSAVSHTDHFF